MGERELLSLHQHSIQSSPLEPQQQPLQSAESSPPTEPATPVRETSVKHDLRLDGSITHQVSRPLRRASPAPIPLHLYPSPSLKRSAEQDSADSVFKTCTTPTAFIETGIHAQEESILGYGQVKYDGGTCSPDVAGTVGLSKIEQQQPQI